MSDIEEISINSPVLGFTFKKRKRLILKEGETVIIRSQIKGTRWPNRKYRREALTLKNGNVEIQYI